MSFIVEDGSGLASANSYVSIVEADAYVADNATPDVATAWAALDDATKQARLRRGTQYLERTYKGRWTERKSQYLQALAWPRAFVQDIDGYAVASNVVPKQIKDATVEAALRAVTDMIPDLDEPGQIKSESVSAGPVQSSTTYVGGKSQIRAFRVIDLLVAEFLVPWTLERA